MAAERPASEDRASGDELSRRSFLKTGVTAAAALGGAQAGMMGAPGPATAAPVDDAAGTLVLVNGRIHTMDDRGTVVSSVAIKNGRITAVGKGANQPVHPSARRPRPPAAGATRAAQEPVLLLRRRDGAHGRHRRVGRAPSRCPRAPTTTRSGTRRSAWSPGRAGATRTRRPARRPAARPSSRSWPPTEAVDREFGITHLRWGLQHADFATPDQLARLKALNCGVSMSGFRWLNGVPRADGLPVGPLYPRILASGIPAGLHEDGVHIAPHNPWFAMHYATTGLNVLGQQINRDQQISRQEALHAYTRGNAWYLNREKDLGSIEVGKLADLVVLDRDYFSVSDADVQRTLPVLTVVGGAIVYDAGVLK